MEMFLIYGGCAFGLLAGSFKAGLIAGFSRHP